MGEAQGGRGVQVPEARPLQVSLCHRSGKLHLLA